MSYLMHKIGQASNFQLISPFRSVWQWWWLMHFHKCISSPGHLF